MKVDDSTPYAPAPLASPSSSGARTPIAPAAEYNEKSASAFGGDRQVK